MTTRTDNQSSPKPTNDAERRRIDARPAIVLALAVALIALGTSGGAFTDVWQRAAMVCYECIGIG